MAYGAIRAATKLGLSVPEDVSIVGFDDQNLAEFYNPPLTTVNIPRHELGRRAAQELLDQLAGREVAREVTLPTPGDPRIHRAAQYFNITFRNFEFKVVVRVRFELTSSTYQLRISRI